MEKIKMAVMATDLLFTVAEWNAGSSNWTTPEEVEKQLTMFRVYNQLILTSSREDIDRLDPILEAIGTLLEDRLGPEKCAEITEEAIESVLYA